MVATAMRPIYAQPDAAHVPEQFDEIVSMLTQRFPDAATMLVDARDDVLAFKAFPQARWRNTWSTNPLERLKGEIKRRTRVVGIFPNDAAVLRLVTGDTAHTSILRRNEPPAAGTRSSAMNQLQEEEHG